MSAGDFPPDVNPGRGYPDVKEDRPGIALKIGIAGALGLGAIVSGLLISRRGRRLVREAWQGRRRTRLGDEPTDAEAPAVDDADRLLARAALRELDAWLADLPDDSGARWCSRSSRGSRRTRWRRS